MSEQQDEGRRLTPAVTLVLLAAWALLLLVTHHGPRSPYTYVSELTAGRDLGRVAGPDGITVLPVTRFFYDGTPPADFSKAHNLWLPLHSFAAAVGTSFLRHYLWSNSIVNLLFVMIVTLAAVRLGVRYGIRQRALLLGLATLYALPPVLSCIGQPLHYVVATAITFLVMLTAIALDPDDLRNPWIAGALTALLTLNYHWYVFVAALITYLALVRFRRRRDDLLYIVVAATPVVVWEHFLRALAAGRMSTDIRRVRVMPVIYEWADFLAHPVDRVLMPLIATQVGAAIGLHLVIALIYWPLLVATVCALWIAHPRLDRFPGNRLVLLLVAFFLLEQLVSAAFDLENSPRRALSFFFAFAWAYCWVIHRFADQRAWMAAFGALFVFTSFFAFADVVFDRAGGSFLYVGEAMWVPKDAMYYETSELPREPYRPVDPQPELRGFFPDARLHLTGATVFAQLFVACAFVVLFWLAARARLLPRAAPWIAAGVWVASLAARCL